MCNLCSPAINNTIEPDTAADLLIGMLNQGALALMVSIGHRTGLFDTLTEIPPAASSTIAQHTGLSERYVREWLATMVVGNIIKYDPDTQLYSLPGAYADLLSRRASPDNIAVFAQYIGLLGQVEDRIVDCFHQGGGVAYEHYPRFHEVMAEDSSQTVIAGLEQYILPLVDGLEQRLQQGIDVLDIGCGRGQAMLHLAKRYPNSRFTGIDLSNEAITQARRDATANGVTNLNFETRDLSQFNRTACTDRYDFVTSFDAIHDQAKPQNVLDGIFTTLKPGGTYLMQDIRASSKVENNLDHPIGPLLYTLSCMHCMTVSLAQDGAGLGTMWGEELALEMLQRAGFHQPNVHQLEHDFQNNFYVMGK